jgi:hypothetical protein
MKNELSEEELQRLLEETDSSFQPFTDQTLTDDLAAYQYLFTALKQSPPGSLSPNFSADVVERIYVQRRQSANRRFYAVLSALFSVGLVLSVGWGELIDLQSAQAIIHTLYSAKSWLLFGLGCLLIIQLLDHQLIKKRMEFLP